MKSVILFRHGKASFDRIFSKSKSPNCNICPLQNNCFAFNNNLIFELPKKAKKLKIRKRYFEFLIINENEKILIQKREKGIWKGLYQFPLIENSVKKSERDIENSKSLKKKLSQMWVQASKSYKNS